ncbi:MAG: glyoxalase superfamily protein [Acinetobacter parvus]
MAFTRIALFIRIFDENKAKEFYVEFLESNIDLNIDPDDAPLYMQVSASRMPSVPNIRPQKKHPFHSISTPPELVELK